MAECTDVERVIVTAEAVYDGLLGCCLVAYNPIRLTILWYKFPLGRARDSLREALPGYLCTKVERRRL